MSMKKILTEWRTFLKEGKEEDDLKVANTFVNALASGTDKDTQEEIRKQKQRILRIIDEFLFSDKHFIVSPNEDVVQTLNGKQYYFPRRDFVKRIEVAKELISDGDYDLSRFSKPPTQLTDEPVNYDDYQHSGGPADTGLRIPEAAFEKEPRGQLDKYFQLWTDYYRGFEKKGTTPQEKLDASKAGLEAVNYFIHLYDTHTSKSRKGGPEYPLTPDDPYFYDLVSLRDFIDNQIQQFQEMVDQEPPPVEKSPLELATEEVARLKAIWEKTGALSRQLPNSPDHKKQIEQAKKDLPAAKKAFRDAKTAMRMIARSMRGR